MTRRKPPQPQQKPSSDRSFWSRLFGSDDDKSQPNVSRRLGPHTGSLRPPTATLQTPDSPARSPITTENQP
jgi:hypothetical protein